MKMFDNVTANEVYNFYNWLIIKAKKDSNELELNGCIDLNNQYQSVIKTLEKQVIINNDKFEKFNINSIERFKIIIDSIKQEYETIDNTNEKDIIYFNSLLGWYEDIPLEINMFVNSLLNKQGEDSYILY